ncbi:hypothetical protein GW7_11392 [Heterocephalus glaber]|uniref:Atos homolog protein A n=1 Tax=Heterocephalus glaber TaxID=10181 RepID=G5C0J9_HETGA|nr:hypothetical protein GW7_11392 [Heterocephalus glaber]
MKPEQDALDEYFEYDSEEFLVSLALLITEGRTPECSVKGPRRTRSEVTLLWKSNLPVTVEVMLLPDCCYSDNSPSTEGTNLNDPAVKQDALLLERWILEPVPQQNGGRFVEEKTLLLAVRSFVFFSQLSAWLSVSHGAVPQNILYRISAADERQDVIARIAHHLEHIDPAAPHAPWPTFHLHDSSSLPSKVFQSSCDDKHLWKNGNGGSASLPPSKPSLLGDSTDGKSLLPDKACSSFRCSSREKSSMEPQVQTRHQHSPRDGVQSGCPETRDRATALLASSHVSQCSDSDVGLISRLENTLEESQLKKQEGSTGIEKQYSDCNSIDNKIFVNKCKGKIINSDHCNSESFDNLQFNNSKQIDSNMKVNMLEMPEYLNSAPPITSLSLLGNFEESILNFHLDPPGVVDGFTAEVGASGVFCPTHLTLPVEVSFYSVSDDNTPSPYMGVITLEALGKRGYRVPPSGTIQVTLFNPNKTVVKMFVVMYDLRDMPANHQTFLRQRTFSVPVRPEARRSVGKDSVRHTEERLLRYLIHLRFQSSRSGKIYLHRDVRLLFSRKSMEVDRGAA